MVSGKLFPKEGPVYGKVFCYVLVSQIGCLSFANYFLCLFYSSEQIQRFHSDKKYSFYLENWKLLHLCIGELFI